jgi:hypothetical protein
MPFDQRLCCARGFVGGGEGGARLLREQVCWWG